MGWPRPRLPAPVARRELLEISFCSRTPLTAPAARVKGTLVNAPYPQESNSEHDPLMFFAGAWRSLFDVLVEFEPPQKEQGRFKCKKRKTKGQANQAPNRRDTQ